MPKYVSLTLREALFAQHTGEVAVVLATLEHDDFEEPLRFSSDATQRLSDDPLIYGTISQSLTYYFAMMTAILPHDDEKRPPYVTLVFDNVGSDIVSQIRSIQTPIAVTLRVVLASAPNNIEEIFTDLHTTDFSWSEGQVTLECSQDPLMTEPCPAHRMVKPFAPGLFK